MSEWPWDELGIDQTRDTKAIRSAYSAKLKALDLDKQIEEYSRLRQARGLALYLAQNPEEEEDDLGLRDTGLGDTGLGDTGSGDPGSDWDEPEAEVPRHYEGDDNSQQAGPGYSENAPAPDPEAELLSQKFNAMSAIVMPGGEQSDDGFTYEEFEEARSLLREILDIGSNATLDLYQGLDFHISEVFAMGWPRSAPLVEDANTEFNWFAEVGQLTERPALVFLNERLAGMRFQEKVETPGHKYHVAWNDLVSGSQPIWLRRIRLGRDTVLELLGVIRVQHPELEALLDPMRIQAWEGATTSVFGRIIQIIAILWFALAGLGYCTRDMGSSGDGVTISADGQAAEAAYEELVAQLLGEEWSGESLELASPIIARELRYAAETQRDINGKPSAEAAMDEARHSLRLVLSSQRDSLDFDGQVRAYQLMLTWLTMARAEGLPECKAMLNGVDFTPKLSPSVDPSVTYEEEKAVFNLLLKQGDPLSDAQSSDPRSMSIPGDVVTEVINKTKLSEAQVSRGLGEPQSEERCDVMIALMETVARAPGRVPAELLLLP